MSHTVILCAWIPEPGSNQSSAVYRLCDLRQANPSLCASLSCTDKSPELYDGDNNSA